MLTIMTDNMTNNSMTNDKPTMKVYTEDQVIKMIEKSRETGLTAEFLILANKGIELPSDSLCINCDESKSTHNVCIDCMIKIGKENIELPSDEEIKTYLNNHSYEFEHGFKDAIEFIKNKIQGGNNEQQ